MYIAIGSKPMDWKPLFPKLKSPIISFGILKFGSTYGILVIHFIQLTVVFLQAVKTVINIANQRCLEQPPSPFYRAMLCTARTIAVVRCPSVCPFVGLSVTRRYFIEIAKHIVRLFPPPAAGSRCTLLA